MHVTDDDGATWCTENKNDVGNFRMGHIYCAFELVKVVHKCCYFLFVQAVNPDLCRRF